MNPANASCTNSPTHASLDTATASSHGVIALVGADASPHSNWGLVRVHGADATSFLHNQLTQDVSHMGPSDARLAAWCNAKGRMVASFVLVREHAAPDAVDEPSYLLLCRRDVMAGFMQKLRMYVLRSKVVIEDASSSSMAAYGLLGDAALAAWQAQGQAEPLKPPTAPWQCLSLQEGTQHRYIVSLHPATVDATTLAAATSPRAVCLQTPDLPIPSGPTLPLWQWEWSEIASGVPNIEQASSGLFVPQMVNFESVGGVSFKKGCYPGQEVVARSQFRGAIKRRGQIAAVSAAPAVGDEVWFCPLAGSDDRDDSGDSAPPEAEPCGTLLQVATPVAQAASAANAPTPYSLVFASLQNSSIEAAQADQGQLRIGHAQGPVLQLYPLPYPLIEV